MRRKVLRKKKVPQVFTESMLFSKSLPYARTKTHNKGATSHMDKQLHQNFFNNLLAVRKNIIMKRFYAKV